VPRLFDIQRIEARETDLLARIDPLTAGDPKRREHIGELLALGLSWGAFDNGQLLGFAVVTRHFFNFPFVDLLLVAEAQRRQGVGRALMDHCEQIHDADRIFTSTNESNGPMRALMAGAGWRPCGQVDALDPGDPELFFVKFRAPAG
jgi:GNAT superfamily N-acetyltransferase